jgi:hypothetical protein
MYLDREPPEGRPSDFAFGSHDARRRDEFTNHIRAQQWKEILTKEHKWNAPSSTFGVAGNTAGGGGKLRSNDVYLTTAQQVAAHQREKQKEVEQKFTQLNESKAGAAAADGRPQSAAAGSAQVCPLSHRITPHGTARHGTAPHGLSRSVALSLTRSVVCRFVAV